MRKVVEFYEEGVWSRVSGNSHDMSRVTRPVTCQNRRPAQASQDEVVKSLSIIKLSGKK